MNRKPHSNPAARKVPTPAPRRPNVTGHSYNTATRDLDVTFSNGRVYRYANVPAKKAVEFGEAESRGQFLHRRLIPDHDATEIFPENGD